jgi:hypothetical protein
MDKHQTLTALQQGNLNLEGQFIYGSNYTLLALCRHKGQTLKTVYKPLRGERPLWDFPHQTLSRREVAAYMVSEALGWNLVPPTVFRLRGAPMGPGSLQLFIDHNPKRHYFTFDQDQQKHLPKVMLFDLLINNADRKAGHLLIDPEGDLFLIDHGLSFHAEDKLRTVVWDHAGEPIPPVLCQDVNKILPDLSPGESLFSALQPHLLPEEIAALQQRGQGLVDSGQFPLPPEDRRVYPWPLV